MTSGGAPDAVPSRARIRAAIPVLVVLAVAGCGSTTPGPSEPGVATPVFTVAPSRDDAGRPSEGGPAATPSPMMGTFRRGGIPVPPDVLAAASDLCRTKPVPPYAEEIGSRPLVVSDLRGLGVVILVFADGKGATGCRVDVDQAGGMRAAHFDVAVAPAGELERGAITLGALEYVEDGTNQRTIAVGRVGEGAVKVRAGFDDDTYVTSTMANGWYAMWWPGAVKASVIVAADNRNVAMGKLTPP